ncbi:vWA domain-containing protein [Butyrivibrio sp. VCB2006]|uniref:vWA domain-containing protein n=1 Tax=Butyrivibrio sp. VCB2006 TaxID=1280679 RepID=UPI00042667EC|nr:vWA domain-containing protein [Butyrivibrio sp. VCB2006]
MKMRPILPPGLMLLVFAIFMVLTVFIIARNKTSLIEKAGSIGRMAVIYLLVLIIGLRPVTIRTDYEFATKNLDVLFVIDGTLSMWALDYNGREERMEGVKQDVNFILSELAGSNFGLVTFDDTAHVLSPFTQDLKYISDMVDVMATPETYYSSGSNLATPYKDMEALLLSSNKKENRKTIVFFLSDGEVTNDSLEGSYEEFAQYIDAGAVLGYGSEAGGKMKEYHSYVYDYDTHDDAISRIDEENLKRIANEMGVQYMNMNGGNTALTGLIEMIKEQSATVVEQADGAERYVDTYYYYAAVLAAMLILETAVFIRKGRL